jgi:hypothetical protein
VEVIFGGKTGMKSTDKNMQKTTKISAGFLPEIGQF